LPLQAAIKESLAVLEAAPIDSMADEIFFAEERQLLQRLKTLVLVIIGAAVKKYQDRVQQEQEILMTVADMAIQIFALESAVLRAEKAYAQSSPGKKELYLAVARVCAYKANKQVVCAAQKGAFYIAGDEALQTLRSAVHRFGQYDASGLLNSKRILAEATSEAERYPF